MTDRATLLHEVDARFWALGYKPGQKLDASNPQDQKMIPVWEDIFKKVQAEDNAGKLVLTHLDPKVAKSLLDAAVANKVAEVHVDAAVKATDPHDVQANTDAARTAVHVSSLKTREAAMNQPPTVAPKLVQEAVKEIAQTPPPPHAPAGDHIAHAQTQNGKMLRPEEDPWEHTRDVPKSKSPREQPPARPPASPREQPPRELLYNETNTRFWNRHHYKPHQRLDMSIPEDQKMAKIWMDIFHEVQREANAGRLTLTPPEAAPPPAVPPPMQQPIMPSPMGPPMQQPGTRPPMYPPMYPPMRPPMYPPMYPPMRPMPPMGAPQRPPMGPMGPMRPPMDPGAMRPPMGPGMRPGSRPGMPTPGMPTPGMPTPPTPTEARPTGAPPLPAQPTQPTEGKPEEKPAETAPKKEEPGGFPWGLIVLGVATAAGITYAVTRKPSRKAGESVVPPPSASPFPSSRGARGARGARI